MKLKLLINLFLTMSLVGIILNAISVRASSDVIKVPEDYPLIQWAINAANPGDTILVSGYQQEWVTVNKTLTLVGGKDAGVDKITITAPKVNITGFKQVGSIDIAASKANVIGFERVGSIKIGDFGDGSRIINNTIWGSGIVLDYSSTDNVIIGNRIIITKDYSIGIYLKSSANYNSIIDNVIADTGGLYSTGLKVEATAWQGYSNISYNTFYQLYTSIEYNCYNNIFHHNNFIQPKDWRARWFNHISPNSYGTNVWDNGTVGNYWSDYNGRDVDGDGIGDTYLPHHGIDNYPLIKPWDKVPPEATKIEFRDSESKLITDNTVVEDSEVWIRGDGYDNTAITSYEWNFGDNTTEKGSTPDIWAPVGGAQRTYTIPGTYNVSLTVWDLGGINDTIYVSLTVLRDTDGDGIPDVSDNDDDGDDHPDGEDAFPLDSLEWLDTDSDGTGNNADLDDDNDGIPDTWEIKYGLNPLDPSDAFFDPDNDNLINLQEYQRGTNPNSSDLSARIENLPWLTIGAAAVAAGIVLSAVFYWRYRSGRKLTKTSQST